MRLTNGIRAVAMCPALRRSLVAGFSAIALVAFGPLAKANLIQNGSFESTSLSNSGPFVASGTGAAVLSAVADWYVDCAAAAAHACSTADPDLTLVFPGTGTTNYGYNNDALYMGTPPNTMPATSPDGGNFVAADGDPNYSAPFFQTISGLTAGQTYTLTFYQAAAQQVGLSGATTEQFEVTLGSQIQYSTLMTNPSEGFTPWNQQTMTFTATSASEVLTFLSLGAPGGAPPLGLLDGVSLNPPSPPPASTPEPSGLALIGIGAGIIALRRLQRK